MKRIVTLGIAAFAATWLAGCANPGNGDAAPSDTAPPKSRAVTNTEDGTRTRTTQSQRVLRQEIIAAPDKAFDP